MKKVIILSFLLLCSTLVSAQKTSNIYCEIVGKGKLLSSKVEINLDFGQSTTLFEDTSLRDKETGEKVKFNSMVDAMNWMGANGWEFMQAYVVTIGQTNVYHWLLKLDVANLSPEELEKVKAMFVTKTDLKK